ncbi:MAG: translation elongation factor 4 [Patescibacteria group bacterium]
MKDIRNFCIIAHIDHGKSTLADRLLEKTETVTAREMKEQLLDTMDLERERGITIKLQPVRMKYKGYTLNLIDTPGHVDFTYEVSRSLAAVEGAILLVDATQGIEAQTLANLNLALEHDLEIIPAINKIDLPAADPERIINELESVIGIKREEVLLVSGKTGDGVMELLDAVVERVPEPKGNESAELRGLVFDSYFDPFRGVVAYVRIMDGEIKSGQKIRMMASGAEAEVMETGFFMPKLTKQNELETGQIGYVATGLKEVSKVRVGDTITGVAENPSPLPGYKPAAPFVYAGLFTVDNADFPQLREALDKLQLSDSALVFEPESSPALGFGFRCGFLGLLHMEIVQERLEREFNLDLVTTTPSVSYKIVTARGHEEKTIHNPTELPESNFYISISEPWIKLEIVTPNSYLGGVMQLIQGRRGVQVDIKYLDADRVLAIYEIPLASVITDFYDQLKSISSGYASLTYEMIGFREGDLVKVDVLLNGDVVDTLSVIVHKSEVQRIGNQVTTKLKELLPKQSFKIVIQAAIGGRIISRSEIAPFRKDVTAKLYGGDVTRKNKLLDKQKKGKKRMKMVGKVEIPQAAFMKMLEK